jgi:hypothetical protein
MQAMGHPRAALIVMAAWAPLALSAAAAAGTIEGAVVFPGQAVPSLTIYASEVDSSRMHTARLARGQASFTLEVPPGRYLLFMAPNEPGAPDVYGAYTRYSLCAPRTAEVPCADHALIPVNVGPKAARIIVAIDDWYLTDDIAAQIDRILGAAAGGSRFSPEPLSYPRFSEYPSESFEPTAPPKIDAGAGAGELSEEDRDIVRQALAGGPNFAGYVTLSLTRCGLACGRIVLIDWRSGAVSDLKPLTSSDETQGTLPCRTDEALLFRRDSRLFSLTRVRGTAVVTQYYVWNQKGAAPMRGVEYQRPSQAFCAVAAG